MFLSEEEYKNRVSSIDNLINKLELRKLHNGGRPKGRLNDTTEDRVMIATHSIVHGPTVTATEFNTTPSRASLLSQGIITHHLKTDEELATNIKDKKSLIHERALDIIMSSLTKIGDKVGDVTKATELAQIASDMAKIAEKTGGRLTNQDEDKPKVQVIVYAPRIRDSSEYDVIDG